MQTESPVAVDSVSSDPQSLPPQRPKSSLKWLWIPVGIGCLSLAIGAYYGLTTANQPSTPLVNAPTTPTPTARAISALGRIEPEGEVVKVAAPSALGSARITELFVQTGDRVQANQILARLDSYDRALAELTLAQSQAQEQQSRLDQINAGAKQGDILAQERQISASQANLNRLQTEFATAQSDLNRNQELFQAGAISAITLDSFRVRVNSLEQQLRQAREQVQQARAQLTSIAEVRPTDIRLAESQLATALVNVRRAEVNLELSQVRAPISGQVLKIHSKAGENVSITDGLLELGNTNQMLAIAEVFETDISNIRVGQTAEITSDALVGAVRGKVQEIGLRVAKNDILGTDPAARTDVRVVEVKIRLNESAKVAKLTNLQVQVRIFNDQQ